MLFAVFLDSLGIGICVTCWILGVFYVGCLNVFVTSVEFVLCFVS